MFSRLTQFTNLFIGVSSNAAKRREGANEVEMTGT